jgi:hypothetical protein
MPMGLADLVGFVKAERNPEVMRLVGLDLGRD